MPWGTPDQVLEKLERIRDVIDMRAVLCHFCFAGMPWDEAERSMRLFASEVLPELKRWEAEPLLAGTQPIHSVGRDDRRYSRGPALGFSPPQPGRHFRCVIFAESAQQLLRFALNHQHRPVFRLEKALGEHVIEELKKVIVIAENIEQAAWLLVYAELLPRPDLGDLLERPAPPGSAIKPSASSAMSALRSCMELTTLSSVMCE